MKVTSNISKMLIIAALTVNGVGALAQNNNQQVGNQMSASLQAGKIEQLKANMASLVETQKRLSAFNADLGNAIKSKGGYQVTLDQSSSIAGWSKLFFLTSTVGRIGAAILPLESLSMTARKPLNVVMMISGITLAVGTLGEFGSQYMITISEGQKIQAEANIENVLSIMDTQKKAIVELSKDLGAKVSQNIISFEGAPELKSMGIPSFNLNTNSF